MQPRFEQRALKEFANEKQKLMGGEPADLEHNSSGEESPPETSPILGQASTFHYE